tara:strand:- start:1266 stop:1565 length:300 start_codon:yes stop_codon:yes gene_type:complete
MGIKINDREVKEMFKELEDMPQFVMEKTYPFLKSRTPVKSGNARNKTRLEKNKSVIGSRYPYADRLDTGWSQQAPSGFTEPATAEIDNLVSDQIRKIGQ